MKCRCAALIFALTLAESTGARSAATASHENPVSQGALTAVAQAYVSKRVIRLPIVPGKDIRFTHLTTAEGLSQMKVSQILQDDRGFMWFGTQYGLNRYDGYGFKTFVHESGKPKSLSGVFIGALFKDHSGTPWVSCGQLLNRFDLATETFTQYSVPFVNQISEDANHLLWLATGKGLYSLNPVTGEIRGFSHDLGNPRSLSSNDVKFSGEDRQGNFWVATGEGLDEFDRTIGEVRLHIPLREPLREFSFYEDRFGLFWILHASGDGLAIFDRKTTTLIPYSFYTHALSPTAVAGARTMLEDTTGNLWIGTDGAGLLRFDRQNHRFIAYRHDATDPTSLSEDSVTDLFEDRTGNIWASLGGRGIERFSPKPLPFSILPYTRPNAKGVTIVNAVYKDREGSLWIATRNIVNRIDPKAGVHSIYPIPDVISMIEDPAGAVWLGTFNHGLYKLYRDSGKFKVYRHNPADSHSLSNNIVPRVVVDHQGTLWAATWDGLDHFDAKSEQFTVYQFDPSDKNLFYLELTEAPDGNLWLGTHAEGIQSFDPKTGQFTGYAKSSRHPILLSDNRVNSIHFDRKGTMWVGTQNGLDEVGPDSGTSAVYTERDGLSGNAIGCVLEDSHGNLWMSTNKGVARFNPQTKTFTNFSIADGLPGSDLTGWGACFTSTTGEMFFGGFGGGVSFYPDRLTAGSDVPVVFTDFKMSGKPATIGSGSPLNKSITYTGSLVLPHNQRTFSIEFAALDYSNPQAARYRYKLEGLDKDWNEVGSNQRVLSFNSLPAGKYVLEVQARSGRGVWSRRVAALAIEILPPWWDAWWFRAACAIGFVVLLWIAYRWRVQQLRCQEKRLKDVVETIPAMAFSALPDGTTDFVNRPWLNYMGISQNESLGSAWQFTVHPDDVDAHVQRWQASLQTGAPFDSEARHRNASGSYRWFLVRAVALRDAHGKIVRWYGTLTDIEDRKRAEQERERLRQLEADLARVNRISMLGELAASLSHELRQPITAAITNARTCLRWLGRDRPDVQEAQEATQRVVNDNTRAAEIINRLRSFCTKEAPAQREAVDINELARETLTLLRSEANRYSVSTCTEFTAGLPKIVADRVQVQQVLLNLMLNAIEAMKEGGGELKIKSSLCENTRVLIAIRDNGVGLPLEKADQIFNAFFTTKPQGTGMGLSISRRIIESHGGHIWATPNPGRGTTFQFTLPIDVPSSLSAA
jgi:PAS domain S-box-containing protein